MMKCTQTSLNLVEALQEILPGHAISEKEADRSRYARSTGLHATKPTVIVKPTDRKQIQTILGMAQKYNTHVYPISGGKNWGYGDSCAPREGCILLDLSGMNRIIEVNENLAYAVVEPGVTQGQLAQYLNDRNIQLALDANGSGPDSSVLGNMVERGVALGPYADRYGNSCNYEIVLPDGTLMNTGLGAYANAEAQHLVKHGCGPTLDGLFTQSNLGIVTRATIWLLPKPETFCTFFVTLKHSESIAEFSNVIRKLRLEGTLRCSVHCFNALRILGGMMRFPWEMSDGKRALEEEFPDNVQKLLKKHNITSWIASGSFQGSPGEVAAAKKKLRKRLRSVPGACVRFLSPGLIEKVSNVMKRLPQIGFIQNLKSKVEKVRFWVKFLQGQPGYASLVGSHWRAREEPGKDQNPLDSRSGLVWLSPIFPMAGDHVKKVLDAGKHFFHKFGFEFQVTVSMLSDRAACAVISLQFDRGNPDEFLRASECHDQLLHALIELGYPPYRGAPQTIKRLHPHGKAFWNVTRKIKELFDPQGTVSPGRYIPDS